MYGNQAQLGQADGGAEEKHHRKSQGLATIEHVLGIIKIVFGLTKVRYQGLAKKTHRLEVTCALANLFLVRRRLRPAAT